MRILLDMDEVLCDFIGGAAAAHGLTRARALAAWPAGTWDCCAPFGAALGRGEPLSDAAFWRPIHGNAGFWRRLEPTPWARSLLELVRSLTDDWWVVSALSLCNDAYAGKCQWLRRFLTVQEGHERLIPLRDKSLLARPGVALVDDKEANVDGFTAAGGHGVLFPHHVNRDHARAADPLAVVGPALRGLAARRREGWADVWRECGTAAATTAALDQPGGA